MGTNVHDAIKVSEMIYRGTLPTFDAARGEVHRVSPRARPVSTLRENQAGIKRLYSEIEVDSVTVPLQIFLEKAAQTEAENAIRNIFGETFVGYGAEAIEELINAKIIRDVVHQWCVARGKRKLKALSLKLKIQNIVSHIKHLLRLNSPYKEKRVKDFCKRFDDISETIVSRSPTGEGFVHLFSSYVEANVVVHKMPSTEQLNLIERQLENGRTFGLGKESGEWLLYMTRELLSNQPDSRQ